VRRQCQKGFTLIEMAVASAVIAVLLSLLISVVQRCWATARCVQCAGNLRQWGIALSVYTTTYGGFIPRRGQGVRPLRNIDREADWFNCLPHCIDELGYADLVHTGKRPREAEQSLFICPSATDPGSEYFLPYAMNMYLSPWIRPDPHQVGDIPDPSRLVFMADSAGPYSSTVPSAKGYTVVARHLGKANLLFLDGSVQAFPGEYIGCGIGDPERVDVRWQTMSEGINQTPLK